MRYKCASMELLYICKSKILCPPNTAGIFIQSFDVVACICYLPVHFSPKTAVLDARQIIACAVFIWINC